jgi:L-rhamnose-H+ transport protein
MVWGFIFVLLGAICGGSFGLPSKYVKKETPWENLWGPFFLFVTVLIPVTLGPLAVDGLFATLPAVGLAAIVPVLVFGFLWGLGSMTLGMSFAFVGLSLAYSINYGAQIACGSILPMVIHNADQIPTTYGYVILAGVAVCLVGVVVAGKAGILKDRSLRKDGAPQPQADSKKPKMFLGLLLAFASGVFCACYAVAFSFGKDVMTVSQQQFGNEEWRSTFVVTALVLWGGAASACLYCIFQLTKNKTWKNFAQPGIGRILLLAAVMAVLHDAAILFWGLGASRLGDLGVSVGYAAFMSFAIIVGNVHGFRSGEWKGASRRSIAWVVAGIVILIIGVCILGQGNAMSQG